MQVNIALCYLPLRLREIGTAVYVHLPGEYTVGYPDRSVAAEVVEVPFRPSANPNAREVAKYKGHDAAE